jgi:hypothetical protein
MTVPVYLVVVQWVLLFTLAALVLVVYRQLGYVFTKAKEPSGPIGPEIGEKATEFEYLQLASGEMRHLTPGHGQPVLLAFVDPTCPACEQVVSILGEVAFKDTFEGVRTLLLMSDPPSYLGASNVFRTTSLEVGHVMDAGILASYRASATPLLVAIDADGFVQRSHPPTKLDESEVNSFALASRGLMRAGATTSLELTRKEG